MNASEFLDRYPEFETGGALIDGVLAEAAGEMASRGNFGTRHDEAQGALAAHKLWASPFGVSLRLEGDESPYLSAYELIWSGIRASSRIRSSPIRGW